MALSVFGCTAWDRARNAVSPAELTRLSLWSAPHDPYNLSLDRPLRGARTGIGVRPCLRLVNVLGQAWELAYWPFSKALGLYDGRRNCCLAFSVVELN